MQSDSYIFSYYLLRVLYKQDNSKVLIFLETNLTDLHLLIIISLIFKNYWISPWQLSIFALDVISKLLDF